MSVDRRSRAGRPFLAGWAAWVLCAAVATPAAAGGDRLPAVRPRNDVDRTSDTLFANVLAVLETHYYDERFRTEELPGLACRYAAEASRAGTLHEQRVVVQDFLSHVPASHLAIWSRATYESLMQDLAGRAYPTFGFQLVSVGGRFYAHFVLEGGPAQRAGLLPWDRVVSLDGVPVERSPLPDWRSDDAHLPDDRDPPVHNLPARAGRTVRLTVERRPGRLVELAVPAARYSALAAARASAREYTVGGRRFGYLHLWYAHANGAAALLAEKLAGDFGDCDGIVLDLRGRGGSPTAVSDILDALRVDRSARRRPVVALLDRQSRSAKDVLAYEMKRSRLARLVGEPTAGAVVPASFADVGHDTVLMFPRARLPRYSDVLELKPVEPDVFAERAGPFSAGDDPILRAGLAEAARLADAPATQRRPRGADRPPRDRSGPHQPSRGPQPLGK